MTHLLDQVIRDVKDEKAIIIKIEIPHYSTSVMGKISMIPSADVTFVGSDYEEITFKVHGEDNISSMVYLMDKQVEGYKVK